MSKKRKGLSVVVTLHENLNINTIERINKINNLINGRTQILFLYDSKPTDEELKIINNYDNLQIKFNQKNLGKLSTIIKHSGAIENSHFKVIDFDDTFLFDGLINVIEFIENSENSESTFFHHAGSLIDKNAGQWGTNTLDQEKVSEIIEESFDVDWVSFSNPQSIINTEIIEKINENWNEKMRLDYFNDNFLSFFSQVFSDRSIFIDQKFYLHNYEYGQTSKINHKKLESLVNYYPFVNHFLNKLKQEKYIPNFKNLKSDKEKFKGQFKYHYRKCLDSNDIDNDMVVKDCLKLIDDIWGEN